MGNCFSSDRRSDSRGEEPAITGLPIFPNPTPNPIGTPNLPHPIEPPFPGTFLFSSIILLYVFM